MGKPVVLITVLVIVAALAGCDRFGGQPIYTGRTTLMETTGAGAPASGQVSQARQLDRICALATSRTIIDRSVRALDDLGMKLKRDELTRALVARPIKDTNIIAIEVTLPEPETAKAATDVVAAKLKTAYAAQYRSGPGAGATLRTVDPAYVSPAR